MNKQTKMPSIITDADKLNAHIVAVNKSANKLNEDIQLALASATYQAVYGRNTNHLNAIIVAVGKGVRKTAIAQWVLKHAPIVMESDKERMKEQPFRFAPDKMEAILHAADMAGVVDDMKKVPEDVAVKYAQHVMLALWIDHKEPPLVPESWSFSDALDKLIKQAGSYESKGTKVTGGDMISRIKDLIASSAASA